MQDNKNFQVDLSGMVELLSRNLYSGPRVFVRELLQNGVDAITARTEVEPGCERRIDVWVSAAARTLKFVDSGKGLTLAQAQELLSTIGASSKRDEFGFHREDYLGQFGIGLLSAFMVSDTITVYSRSIDALDKPVKWVGHSTGTWEAMEVPQDEVPEELAGAGSLVQLKNLDFDAAQVPKLVEYFGRFLDVDIYVGGERQDYGAAPWELTEEGQAEWCKANFGFEPFACIELNDIIAGARGVAFVVPQGVHPGQSVKHMVFLRRMLLGDRVADIMPDWSYFVRVVVDVENLRPTASREQLLDDDMLAETRQSLGDQVRDWLVNLQTLDPVKFDQFVALHYVGLKSLALVDEPTRRLVARCVPVQTTQGEMTYDAILEQYGVLRFSRTPKDFESISAVAAARDLCVVNAGYAFDSELIALLKQDYPNALIKEMDAHTLLNSLEEPEPWEQKKFEKLLAATTHALEGQRVTVALKRLEPADLPCLFVHESAAAEEHIRDDAATSGDPLAFLMDVVDTHAHKSSGPRKNQFILNADNALITQLASSEPNHVVTAALRGLYVQSLISARQDLDNQARAWSTSMFSTLISQSLK